jgi:hypothetical protein
MDFNPNDYVQRGSPEDNFPDGEAEIISCRYCDVASAWDPARLRTAPQLTLELG